MDVTRFAPSPTGALHIGHAYAALFAAARGAMVLRHEDIDPGRARAEHIAGVEADLAWLGLDWPRPAWRQSERLAVYGAALERLRADGLVYPCFCTRAGVAAEIAASGSAPHGPEGPVYPGTCRGLGAGERAGRIAGGVAHAWRLDMAAAVARAGPLVWEEVGAGPQRARPEAAGDVVLARKDAPASYHLAVVVDDAAQGVTLVTRGRDLFGATHVHRLLQALLALPVPRWSHHPLLVGADGRRLAKRDGAPALSALREAGMDGPTLARDLMALAARPDGTIWVPIRFFA